jgi:hypothetical protein
MDPVTFIVGALVAGASLMAKTAAEEAVKDAYKALKAALSKNGKTVEAVGKLESKPASEGYKLVLKEEVEDAGLQDDPQVIAQARKLVDAIAASPDAGYAIDIAELKSASVNIGGVTTHGSGAVKGTKWDIAGDVSIKNIDTTGSKQDKKK